MLRTHRLSLACSLKRQVPTYLHAVRHWPTRLSFHAAILVLGRLLLIHQSCVRLSILKQFKYEEADSMQSKSLDDP